MKMPTTPRVEPTFGDAPPAALVPDAIETAWPEVPASPTAVTADRQFAEDDFAGPAGPDAFAAPAGADAFAAPPVHADALADADAFAAQASGADAAGAPTQPARKPLPVKLMLLGGVAAAGLAGAIAWIGNAAQEARHHPQAAALAAPPGMSAKALPAPAVQAIAPQQAVAPAFLPPSEPQRPVPPPAAPVAANVPATVPSRRVAAVHLAETAPAKTKGAARAAATAKAEARKAKKAVKPAKAGAVREPRKAAASTPVRKTATAAKPRCETGKRNAAACRAIGKSDKK